MLESPFLGSFGDVAFPQAKVQVEQFEGWCSERFILAQKFHELRRKGTGCAHWDLCSISDFLRFLSMYV